MLTQQQLLVHGSAAQQGQAGKKKGLAEAGLAAVVPVAEPADCKRAFLNPYANYIYMCVFVAKVHVLTRASTPALLERTCVMLLATGHRGLALYKVLTRASTPAVLGCTCMLLIATGHRSLALYEETSLQDNDANDFVPH